MDKSRVLIVGAGGLGRETCSILHAQPKRYEILGYLDDDPAKQGREFCKHNVLGGLPKLADFDPVNTQVIIAIGRPSIRRQLAQAIAAKGFRFATAVHPDVSATPWVDIAEGAIVMAGAVMTVEVAIGAHAVVNPGCTLAHDCQLGAFSYLSPGCHLGGYVEIGEGAELGLGACVLPRVKIGPWAVLGAGAVAIDDIPSAVTAVGVPARIIKQSAQAGA